MRVAAEERRLHLKIVYFGPALSGKTTNLQYVFARTDTGFRTPMESVATDTERTLSFALTPRTLPLANGLGVVLHLATIPGAVFYDVSRKAILDGVDGVVFVADSQVERMEANTESLELLDASLRAGGRALEDVPLVLQYNKRDLANAASIADLERALNARAAPHVAAVAPTGHGVFDTLRSCANQLVEASR